MPSPPAPRWAFMDLPPTDVSVEDFEAMAGMESEGPEEEEETPRGRASEEQQLQAPADRHFGDTRATSRVSGRKVKHRLVAGSIVSATAVACALVYCSRGWPAAGAQGAPKAATTDGLRAPPLQAPPPQAHLALQAPQAPAVNSDLEETGKEPVWDLLPGVAAGSQGDSVRELYSALHLAISGVLNQSRRCEDTEEEFQGLCYRRCTLLTDGQYELRVGPDTCRRNASEVMADTASAPNEVSVDGPDCRGYKVDGEFQCPHRPRSAVCDGLEELYMGFCYKRCALLTSGEYPIRAAANACCSQRPCHNLTRLKIDGSGCTGLSVGSGLQGHACAHLPDHRPPSRSAVALPSPLPPLPQGVAAAAFAAGSPLR